MAGTNSSAAAAAACHDIDLGVGGGLATVPGRIAAPDPAVRSLRGEGPQMPGSAEINGVENRSTHTPMPRGLSPRRRVSSTGSAPVAVQFSARTQAITAALARVLERRLRPRKDEGQRGD